MAARKSDGSIDLNVSRIHKLIAYCRTNLAVKLCANTSVLIGVSFLYRTDCSSNCDESLWDTCIEGADCRSFKSRAITRHEAAFSQFVSNGANIGSIMNSRDPQDTFDAEKTGRSTSLLQKFTICPTDVFHFIYSHFCCHSFFGGLLHVACNELLCMLITSAKSVMGSSSPAFECVAHPYAAFLMLCYKHACGRQCADSVEADVQAVWGGSLASKFNCTMPVYFPSEKDSQRMSSCESISHSGCSQSLEAAVTNGCECCLHNTDAAGIGQTDLEHVDSWQQQMNSSSREENVLLCKSLDSCFKTADLSSIEADCSNCCSVTRNGMEVSYCADPETTDKDFCLNRTDTCSYQYEVTDLLLNDSRNYEETIGSSHEDLNRNDPECSGNMWEDDEDNSDDDFVVGMSDSDSVDSSTSKKPVCSSFFVRASDFDDSDSSSESDASSNSDSDEYTSSDDDDKEEEDDEDFEDDDDGDDDDDDWSTTREPADLSCISDLDPFQISGLYIPPSSTTLVTRLTSSPVETARIEMTEAEVSTKVKHVNEKWNHTYDSDAATVVQTAGRKKVSFVETAPQIVELLDEDEDYRRPYWELFARDRDRFRRRINDTAGKIQWVLTPEHREKVHCKLRQ